MRDGGVGGTSNAVGSLLGRGVFFSGGYVMMLPTVPDALCCGTDADKKRQGCFSLAFQRWDLESVPSQELLDMLVHSTVQ